MESLARALLLRAVPQASRASVLAELELERTRAGGGRTWYVRAALGLALHFAIYRMRGVSSAPSSPRKGGNLMGGLRRDVVFAGRTLGRTPGFALVAAATMALGIGASVAMFTVVKTVVLDPLPYHEPERLVALWEWNVSGGNARNVANPGNVRAWEERATTLAQVASVTLAQPGTFAAPDAPEEVMARMATPDFFRVLGLPPARGRDFAAAGEPDVGNEVMLAHDFWLRRFGGDPAVVGSTVTFGGRPSMVVGVLPDQYILFGEGVDIWIRYPDRSWMLGDQTNTGRYLETIARVAPGETVARAQAEMREIGAALAASYPDFNGGWSVSVVPVQEQVVGDVRTAPFVLLSAAGLLLLIACANVAGLFLARGTHRAREMAVRVSLGAGRGAVVRQVLVESLVLASAGAVLGVALAHAAVRVIARGLPNAFALPRVEAAGLDGSVLLVAAAVTVLTAVLFGLVPALHAGAVDPARTLYAEARGPGRSGTRLRSALVAAEVTVSVILLVGAALLARSFAALTAVEMGIEPAGVVVARVTPGSADYDDDATLVRFFEALQERVSALAGVEAAGAVTFLPMAGPGSATGYVAAERLPGTPRPDWPTADILNVMGDYFTAMGIPLLQGRAFDSRDRADSPPVAVVNRALAEREWPGADPVGRRLVADWGDAAPVEVVGVVEDVRVDGPGEAVEPAIYLPYPQKTYFGFLNLVIRTPRSAADLRPELEAQLAALDPGVPLARLRPMAELVATQVARPRTTAVLMGIVAGLAAFLAAVGLYAVLAFTVASRVREIGVRVALGAAGWQVLGLVTRQGLGLVLLGLVPGVALALAGGRVLESLLFGVPPMDPVSVGAAVILLLIVAAAASAVPAWRALRIAPGEALRTE
jgi:putative ABC transport system permease protein